MSTSYPSALSGPSKWVIKGVDKRASSSLREPSSSHRARSRDKVDVATSEWMYTSDEIGIWKNWFRDTLIKGQRWFSADVPGVTGTKVIRYRLSTLRRMNLGNGVFLVSAEMEVRGLSVFPVEKPVITNIVSNDTGSGDTTHAIVSWLGTSASTSYNLYRNGVQQNMAPIVGLTFTDVGPFDVGPTYCWVVEAIEPGGAISSRGEGGFFVGTIGGAAQSNPDANAACGEYWAAINGAGYSGYNTAGWGGICYRSFGGNYANGQISTGLLIQRTGRC